MPRARHELGSAAGGAAPRGPLSHRDLLTGHAASRARLGPPQVQIPAAVVVGGVAVAKVERAYGRIGPEKDTARLERAARGAWHKRRPVVADLERETGVDALEQLLPHQLVIVDQASEGETVGDQGAGREA